MIPASTFEAESRDCPRLPLAMHLRYPSWEILAAFKSRRIDQGRVFILRIPPSRRTLPIESRLLLE